METQGHWNDLAIERSTQVLFGLYSLTCLFAHALQPAGKVAFYQTAWYTKTEATFREVLATVRRARTWWGYFNFGTSTGEADVFLIPRALLDRLALAACY